MNGGLPSINNRNAMGKNAAFKVRRCSGLLRAFVAFCIPVGYAVSLFGDFCVARGCWVLLAARALH